jgi:hypothetical protein
VRIAALWTGLVASSWNVQALAQSAPVETDSDYERESENPVTRFYTEPLRYKASLENGFYNATTNSVEWSNAVLPIPLDDDWFLIARRKFVSQAPKKAGDNWEDGINNVQTTLFLSPARGSGLFGGPVISFPTATNSVTGHCWSVSTFPKVTANWASQRDQCWTVPVGAGSGKAFEIGGQPMTLKLETYYDVVRTGDRASVWAAQLSLTLLFGR